MKVLLVLIPSQKSNRLLQKVWRLSIQYNIQEYEVLKSSTKFEGVCYKPFPFSFEITSRKGTQIEGTITWLELNSQTKVKGTIEGEELEFEGYETTNPEIAVPINYLGKWIKNEIKGKFKGEKFSGNFEMSLSKK